ncbi:methionyl-tRNA formyltransferase [Marinobacterium sp. xm-a-152]|uniref:methionyl-tRNA formyltransferase n=1 Tax=Marinobacterium sp. xm-a-152 TaxID=2497733 RepID=UPI001569A135|nr:formyltransferase family protein [Marinobacterium sp. xm-a-152]NRP15026.1 Methionyl-tRNA formyltransferase [Marinobacterium sp. xm-a-152]
MITQGVSRIVEPLFSSRHQIVGVLESASRNYKKQPGLHRLMGATRFFYSKIKRQPLSLKKKAEQHGLPYRLMISSDDPGLVEWVTDLKPDIIVVFSMSQLLKEKIFSIPKYGAVNLHPAILPDYRGPNPDFWQYYYMEMHPGVTVHYIDAGEDTGDIIYQERTEIPLGTKSPSRLDKLVGEVGVKLLLKALDSIQRNNAPRIVQPQQSPTPRARNLLTEEHRSIVDWGSWPVERVWHVLCGTELWLNALPQPSGIWKGQRWIVGEFDHESTKCTSPGQIVKENGRFCVVCKDGRIYLTRNLDVKKLIMNLLRR